MKKNSFKIISLLYAAAIFAFLLNSYSWAVTSNKPVVIRKKIHVQDQRNRKNLRNMAQLELTAIILAASGNKALVREASGRGHVISEGTYIGTHRGRVADVLKDKVIVKEKMIDLKGRFFFQKTELKLNKPII